MAVSHAGALRLLSSSLTAETIDICRKAFVFLSTIALTHYTSASMLFLHAIASRNATYVMAGRRDHTAPHVWHRYTFKTSLCEIRRVTYSYRFTKAPRPSENVSSRPRLPHACQKCRHHLVSEASFSTGLQSTTCLRHSTRSSGNWKRNFSTVRLNTWTPLWCYFGVISSPFTTVSARTTFFSLACWANSIAL